MKREYYRGPTAITDYLRPKKEAYIPLVELPASLNPYLATHDIHIDVKLMNTLPLGNVKSLPAWYMLEDARDVKDLHLVEASSGNTAFSLGILAPHFSATHVTAIASPDVSEGKLTLLRLAGIQVTLVEGPICPDPNDPNGAIAVAHREGAAPGHLNLGQYDNDANPKAHEAITGPQLHDQLGDALGMFCAGLGTTGTLLGTARFLQSKLPDVKIAGVIRAANNPVPGVRTKNGLHEVAFPWQHILTEPLVEVDQKEAYEASLRLIRSGLLVGPSAGFAYVGLLKHLERMEKTGEIAGLRGKHVVFVCPDSPLPYAEDYLRILDARHFPDIKNLHLRGAKEQPDSVPTILPEVTVTEVASQTNSEHIPILVDVREPQEFDDHHLPGAVNVPLAMLPRWIKQQEDETKKIVFICRSGNRSARATHLARLMGLDAFNMKGGMVEWSARDYPREKSLFCTTL